MGDIKPVILPLVGQGCVRVTVAYYAYIYVCVCVCTCMHHCMTHSFPIHQHDAHTRAFEASGLEAYFCLTFIYLMFCPLKNRSVVIKARLESLCFHMSLCFSRQHKGVQTSLDTCNILTQTNCKQQILDRNQENMADNEETN